MDLPIDHNFPVPILDCLAEFLVDVRFIPISRIDERLAEVVDRKMLIALHQLGYAGLVTTNYNMLNVPEELAAILKTRLTVLAVEEAGHDPIKATGALLLDLPGALKKVDPHRAQVFRFKSRQPPPRDPWDELGRIAERQGKGTAQLYDEVKVTDAELHTPVLD